MYGSSFGPEPQILFGSADPLLYKFWHPNDIKTLWRVHRSDYDLRYVVLATLQTLDPWGLALTVESLSLFFVGDEMAKLAKSFQLIVQILQNLLFFLI